MIGGRVAAAHVVDVVDWLSFFPAVFSGKRTADPERSSPTYYISIDAVSAKDMPLGGLIDTYHPMVELPKTPHFGDVNGDSTFNVYGRILAQEKQIITPDGSKCASRQDTQCAIVKNRR
jgi:hypothetical protein